LQVPAQQQGALHGALSAVRVLVAIFSVPCFALSLAWGIGSGSHKRSCSARPTKAHAHTVEIRPTNFG